MDNKKDLTPQPRSSETKTITVKGQHLKVATHDEAMRIANRVIKRHKKALDILKDK